MSETLEGNERWRGQEGAPTLRVALALMGCAQQNQPVVQENQLYQAWLTILPLAAQGFSSRRWWKPYAASASSPRLK